MNVKSMNRRQQILSAALLLTLAATGYVAMHDRPRQETDLLVEPHAHAPADTPPNPATPATTPRPATRPAGAEASNARDTLPKTIRDIFAVPQKPKEPDQPAAPPPSVPPRLIVTAPPPVIQPSPAPTAPPLPFTYLGKLIEDDRYTVFLSGNGKNHAVHTGDMIGPLYKVNDIRPPLMSVIYLPLNIQQTLQIGEPN